VSPAPAPASSRRETPPGKGLGPHAGCSGGRRSWGLGLREGGGRARAAQIPGNVRPHRPAETPQARVLAERLRARARHSSTAPRARAAQAGPARAPTPPLAPPPGHAPAHWGGADGDARGGRKRLSRKTGGRCRPSGATSAMAAGRPELAA
jgi:hypothetical protein